MMVAEKAARQMQRHAQRAARPAAAAAAAARLSKAREAIADGQQIAHADAWPIRPHTRTSSIGASPSDTSAPPTSGR